MYHEHRHWGLFLFRIIEIVFTINIVLLDLFVFRSYLSNLTTPVATTQAVAPTPTPTSAIPQPPSPVLSPPTTIINQTTGAQEVFIPIGQGQVTATDWADVPGAEVNIDSSKYRNIQHVVFEVSLESPNNQIVWVQLYDKTAGHPVWNSQMSTNISPQFLTSSAIALDPGNNTYQVQMRSQLQYPATLDQARIHITLE